MVQIHTRNEDGTRHTYTAHTLSDCIDSTDRLAMELCLEHGDTITIGCVIAEPVPQGGHNQ